MTGRENWGMSESLILTLMAIWVARVMGDCGKPPQLKNGVLADEFFSQTSFPVGAQVSYICYPGYHFKEGGSKRITCGANSVWETLKAVCEPRNCGNPGDISNGYYEANETTLGHQAQYYCNIGYMLVGRSYRMCQASGWSGQVPTCEIVTCDDPEPISNGTVSSPSTGDAWQYGMIATYSCLDGYTLIGDKDIHCTSSGKWNKKPPVCKVVICKRPPLSENLKIQSGFGPTYKYRDTITYHCTAGYVMVGSMFIECSENNTFVPSPPTCKLPTTRAETATTTPPESPTRAGTVATTAVTPSKSHKEIIIGATIAGVVAVVVLAGGTLYFYKKKGHYTTFEKVAMSTQTEQVQVKSNVADC